MCSVTFTWLLSDFEGAHLAQSAGRDPLTQCCPATYQKEHSLLQALPGELVQAALTDELLKDSNEVCIVWAHSCLSRQHAGGAGAWLMSPCVLL